VFVNFNKLLGSYINKLNPTHINYCLCDSFSCFCFSNIWFE